LNYQSEILRFDVLTIFPDYFDSPLKTSIIKRAVEKKFIEINLLNLRDFTADKHMTVDDKPYGGGPGMLMKAEPIFKAVERVKASSSKVVLLDAAGRTFRQADAVTLSKEKHLILICGHYEGVDERVKTGLADLTFSIGDYILTNGNIAALIIIDSVARLLPGVLGSGENGVADESFENNLLEAPQWTRPREFRGMETPEILLSGDHLSIKKWRKNQAEIRTWEQRPDLYDNYKKQTENK
jgi:tRNA (guanine37-N1)-methyltransferase